MKKIKIVYSNNKFYISESLRCIPSIKTTLNLDLLHFTSKLPQIFAEKNSSRFNWRGFCTIWNNKVMLKDTQVDNNWYNRIFITYIIKNLGSNLILETDDLILKKTLSLNNLNCLNVDFKGNIISSSLLRMLNYLLSFFKHFIVISISKILNHNSKDLFFSKNSIFFLSGFPNGWKKYGDSYRNRHYENAPYLGKNFGYSVTFLTFVEISNRDFKSLFRLFIKMKNLVKSCEIQHFLVYSLVSYKSFLRIYIYTLKEWLIFTYFKRRAFKNLFAFNGLDLSPIYHDLWESSYFGWQQNSFLNCLGIENFCKEYGNDLKFVTYGELFAEIKPLYFFNKKKYPKSIFIAIQHALNFKNKLFTYHPDIDFSNHINLNNYTFSPSPDYFLVQGNQYQNILAESFPPSKIKVIGSLKRFESSNLEVPFLNKIKTSGGKILLVCPSVGSEYEDFIDLILKLKIPSNWSVVFSLHPRLSSSDFNCYLNESTAKPPSNLHLLENFNSYDALKYCDLLLGGQTSLVIESRLLNVFSARYNRQECLQQFDYDSNIPTFESSHCFNTWFNIFANCKSLDYKNINNSLIKFYFSPKPLSSSNKFWNEIQNIIKNET